ncbi:MAG: division/cell wall cluster transcriptional repressor MraZ [Bacteroidota bacterium]
MPSFKGSYTYSVDSKGRVIIPARLKKAMAPDANETFIVTRGYERCLFAYPQNEWETRETQVRDLPTADPRNRFYIRLLTQWMTETQLDSQGRITLTKVLLQFAGIKDAVLVLGAVDHIELWDPDVYEAYIKGQPESYEDVAEQIFSRK